MPAQGSWGQGWREIELITTDDLVALRDENNPGGAIEWKSVEELFQRTAGVITLTVHGREIRTTSEHPFYHAEKGWLPAGDLVSGDRLVSQYGEVVIVNKVEAGGEYDDGMPSHEANLVAARSRQEIRHFATSKHITFYSPHFQTIAKFVWAETGREL